MKLECDSFPDLKHNDCQLKPDEEIIARYFESRGLQVERLCAARDQETPDLRVTGINEVQFLCEVKKPDASSGNLTWRDSTYRIKEEFERAKEESKKQGVPLIANPDQYKLWMGEVPPPEGERNRIVCERANAKKIKDWLQASEARNFPLVVTIERLDIHNWLDAEIKEFLSHLLERLKTIRTTQLSGEWPDNTKIYWHYSKLRSDGRSIRNMITVSKGEKALDVRIATNLLGPNWRAIEDNCHKAHSQIKSQIEREPTPDRLARLVVIYLEDVDLFTRFIDRWGNLTSEVCRRVLKKFPALSAVAFVKPPFDLSETQLLLQFEVFHTANTQVPQLPELVFDDGYSIQTRCPDQY